MQGNMIILIVLILVLIYFVSQVPAKHTRDVVYVNRDVPIWNLPTGWARPIRRWGPRWRPRFRPGFRPHFRPHHL